MMRVNAILWLLQVLGMPRDGAERRLRLQGELEKNRQVLSDTIALLDEMTPKEKRVPTQEPAEGYVYFILNKKRNAVKIGYSANPAKRLAALQTSNSDKLVFLGAIVGDVSLERTLHEAFRNSRLSGEWFRYEDDVKAYISRYTTATTKL
jgi:hypothetical protein